MKTVFTFFILFSAVALGADRGGSVTYDLGGSSGKASNGNGTYTEVQLGLNWYLQNWLAWRNAGFARFQTDVDTGYGIDTSLRLIADLGASSLGVTAFVAPGYRFAQKTDTAPFAEEGLMFHLGGLTVGGGAKQIFDSWVHQGMGNDNQYFLILGGGGVL